MVDGITECLTLPASRFERNYELLLLSRKRLTDTFASGFNNRSQFEGYLEASVRQLVKFLIFNKSCDSYF